MAGVVGSDCYGEWLVSWGVTVMESGWCRGELPYSGYFSRGVYFVDFAERAQFVNFEISKFKVGVVN